jgi:molybdenum cofactor cytidylyltransferase
MSDGIRTATGTAMKGLVADAVGILLAAGRGERFGGGKLLALVPSEVTPRAGAPAQVRVGGAAGEGVGVTACRNLLSVLPRVVAVVRPDDAALAAALGAAGAEVVRCADSDAGMGASLACGVRATRDAAGWIVALGDMPWIEASTIARVAGALAEGAVVAAPFHRGQRGHPVGFGAACRAALSGLDGDDGAKSVLAAHSGSLVRIDVDDAGTLRDVDLRSDLM